MAFPFAIAALALTGIGTGVSVYGALEQGKAQRDAMRSRQKLESIRAARERTEQIRQARIARGRVTAAGANAGVVGASSVRAGGAGAFSQAFQNIGFINQQESVGQNISRAQQRGINAQGISTLGQGISSIGSTIFTASNIFSGPSGIDRIKSQAPADVARNPGIF